MCQKVMLVHHSQLEEAVLKWFLKIAGVHAVGLERPNPCRASSYPLPHTPCNHRDIAVQHCAPSDRITLRLQVLSSVYRGRRKPA